jgi:hypothetical protein
VVVITWIYQLNPLRKMPAETEFHAGADLTAELTIALLTRIGCGLLISTESGYFFHWA